MKWKKPAFLAIIVILMMIGSGMSAFQISEAAQEDSRINISVDGPDKLFVNETENYEVEIKGVFQVGDDLVDAERADNWTLKTESTMDATVEPQSIGTSTTNVYTVNVTVHEEGKGYLNLTAYCGKNGSVSYTEKQYRIEVEEPEVTTVPINNPTNITIKKMELGLFIDGDKKSTVMVEDLKPGEQRKVTFKWSKEGLSSGEHDLKVWVDYGTDNDPDSFNKQDRVMDRTFHVEGETNTMLYAGVIVAVIAVSFVVFLLYRQRKRKSRRPW